MSTAVGMGVVVAILKDKLRNGEGVAVLLDLEGTLFASETIQEESFKSLAWILADIKEGEEDWPRRLEARRRAAEKMVTDTRTRLEEAGKLAFPSDVRDKLGLTLKDQGVGKKKYYNLEDHIQPYRWLKSNLGALKALHPVKMAVITNQTDDIAKRTLIHIGVYGLVDAVFTQETTKLKKPNPLILKGAAEILDVPIENCVSVGDDPRKDVDPALAIGMHAILVKGPEDVCKLCRDLIITEK